jgi:hypothetical protein
LASDVSSIEYQSIAAQIGVAYTASFSIDEDG